MAEHHTKFNIQVDRQHFQVEASSLTGSQIRALPSPHIGTDRDLFQVVPGGTDLKITDSQAVALRDGLRFFSAPAHITPGSSCWS